MNTFESYNTKQTLRKFAKVGFHALLCCVIAYVAKQFHVHNFYGFTAASTVVLFVCFMFLLGRIDEFYWFLRSFKHSIK
jgi:uncharacterized membrane protein YccC